ncbi:MAG: hypothetical protein GAK45_02188 [Pseudomonas citronellolis]|nr:MAG: hypothetical protein GAK45_02188 [Pseudomonas citronellolis]
MQVFVQRPVQRIVRVPGWLTKARLQVDAGQAEHVHGVVDFRQGAFEALQRRVHCADAEQLGMAVDDGMDSGVGQVLRRRVPADHHGFVQAGLANFGEEALGRQRAFEVGVVATGTDAAVEPAGGVVLRGAWHAAEEGVQVGRAAAQVDDLHATRSVVLPARTSKAPPVSTPSTVTRPLPGSSGKTSSAKR